MTRTVEAIVEARDRDQIEHLIEEDKRAIEVAKMKRAEQREAILEVSATLRKVRRQLRRAARGR